MIEISDGRRTLRVADAERALEAIRHWYDEPLRKAGLLDSELEAIIDEFTCIKQPRHSELQDCADVLYDALGFLIKSIGQRRVVVKWSPNEEIFHDFAHQASYRRVAS